MSPKWDCIPERACFLHIKRLFLYVDIQSNQCPSRFFNSTSSNGEVQFIWSYNYSGKIRQWYTVDWVDNALACHNTGYDMKIIHIIWKTDRHRKQLNKQTQKNTKDRIESKNMSEYICCVPPLRRCGRHVFT